ncbi:keratin, type I cytoskeletal 10-like isoform X2 [Aphidius gifuensis]|uniref:keratin, type I cytoskeletal 10-like isoform X2 n=1 Tax=Aphidius gifuensis TaxID=684658 RepID=UPI001CDD80B9|nr:keratin, type I cytoskeletal 10-like isoform X2 [Aphidius gifuensis]
MMRFTTTIFMAMCLIALVSSNPLPENEGLQSKVLDRLVMVESDNDTAQRSKRTIGILRQLFPQVSKMIEDKVNKIVGEVIKALGPAVLRGALGAQRNMKNKNDGGVRNNGGGSGETVTVPLPSFDDDDDDEDEDLSITNDISTGKTTTTTATTTTTNDSKTGTEITTDDQSKTSSSTSSTSTTTTTTLAPNINPETENQVQQEANNEAAGSENNEVRVQFEDSANEALEPLAPLDDVEVSEDDNRNKRFLSFGGNNGGGAGGGSGSGGGSGNFLFDIIRLVAGSGSAGTSSGGGGGAGAASASAGSDSQAKGSDATQEAVPGPVTRLLVIANRGISNLLQDLILRLAATSERIVNFKARLITSII